MKLAVIPVFTCRPFPPSLPPLHPRPTDFHEPFLLCNGGSGYSQNIRTTPSAALPAIIGIPPVPVTLFMDTVAFSTTTPSHPNQLFPINRLLHHLVSVCAIKYLYIYYSIYYTVYIILYIYSKFRLNFFILTKKKSRLTKKNNID